MAQATLTNKFLISLGDGGGPEVFAQPCGASARNVRFINNMGEQSTLDCDDPLGQPAAIQRWVDTQDTSLSITGKMALGSISTWRQWADQTTTKNIRIEIVESGANGGGYWELPCLLQTLEFGSVDKGMIDVSAEIVGAGARAWTAAA
jgi:hypothetical protein